MMKNQEYIAALRFDSLTFLYDPVVRLTTRERTFKSQLVKQVNGRPDERILDVGCGTATLSIALKKSFPQSVVHGLDGDENILSIALRKIRRENVEVFLDRAFSDALPFKDGYFHTVVSSLFFHHLTPETKRKTLAEIFRVLRPGGFLHVADWGKPSNLVMRVASLPVEWLDGETTKDSYGGKLPALIELAGFTEVVETATFNTLFGTLRLHKAKKD